MRKTRPRIAHTNPAGAGRALAVLSKVLGQRGLGRGGRRRPGSESDPPLRSLGRGLPTLGVSALLCVRWGDPYWLGGWSPDGLKGTVCISPCPALVSEDP